MRGVRIGSIVVALVAAVLLGRMAVFMVDADRRDLSIEPSDAFRTSHSCLSAYAEAARFVGEPATNIYERKLYEQRVIHGLKVDVYEYPPPFLLVPDAMQRVAGGYLELRPFWFVMQLVVLLGACALATRWLGGALGRRVWLAFPLFLVAPTTLFTMQMGNFQSTAVGLSIIGMIALDSRRTAVQIGGGLALAYAAIGKVFPGILAIYLLVTRRWRAAAFTAGAGLVLIGLTLAVYGTAPFDDFIHYQLPRLSDGTAFPQSELPRIAASNTSFYGLLVKLRFLGASALDQPTGLAINSAYGLAVLALAVAVVWRNRRGLAAPLAEAGPRLHVLVLWLALVDLASFRSPFVGGAYGLFGTVWLATIMLAGAETRRARIAWAAVYAVMFVGGFVVPTPLVVPSQTRVVLAALLQVFMIGVNVWICVDALLRARRPKLAQA